MKGNLEDLRGRIEGCSICERLVAWRQKVARERRPAFAAEEYWGRPVSGFGDPEARLAVVGLAPSAHGANRTGRMFTGDRSGDWLYAALHRAGLASQPASAHRADDLRLTGIWVTAAVRCAPPRNRPTVAERDSCLPFLDEELELLENLRVVVALGGFAYDSLLMVLARRGQPLPKPRRRFAHGLVVELQDPYRALVASFHPSQQNTFTGRLTRQMLDDVFARALAMTR